MTQSLFTRGDFDGFIGLFIDNLVNLLIITGLSLSIGMPADIIFGRILPATALSVLAGNIFYSRMALKLAKKEGRRDVTALPYGVNTVSLFAFFSLIIAPIYLETKNAELAWMTGVLASLVSGIFEGLGAFIGEKIRSITPRAALLSTLSGIALAFIALEHTMKLWDKPLIGFIPLALILVEYFSRTKLPFKIPAGFYALILGGVIAWSGGFMDGGKLLESLHGVSFYFPLPVMNLFFDAHLWSQLLPYLSVAIPMGIMSFFGTLQNLESAAAAGDNYPAAPALAMNGIGTIIGSLFGSPFPTTVYIGHPGWKGLGAGAGYSIINGVVITLISFTGLMGVISALIPLEAGYPILMWIGIIITAQAFQETPKHHAPAVALGLLPAIASWGLTLLRQFINASGQKSAQEANQIIAQAVPHLKGISILGEGALFSAMFLTAMTVWLIERDFVKSSIWAMVLATASFFGLIHSSTIAIAAAWKVALGYTAMATIFIALHVYNRTFLKE